MREIRMFGPAYVAATRGCLLLIAFALAGCQAPRPIQGTWSSDLGQFPGAQDIWTFGPAGKFEDHATVPGEFDVDALGTWNLSGDKLSVLVTEGTSGNSSGPMRNGGPHSQTMTVSWIDDDHFAGVVKGLPAPITFVRVGK